MGRIDVPASELDEFSTGSVLAELVEGTVEEGLPVVVVVDRGTVDVVV